MRTAIIGAGFVGRAWAITFARASHDVRLWDADPEASVKALAFIETILPDLEANGLLNGATPDDLRGRITPVADLAEALSGVEHVQENTPEALDVKRAVFADLDAGAPPGAIIASSTSALLPSAFQGHVTGRGVASSAIPSIRPISSRRSRSCPPPGPRPIPSGGRPTSCEAAARRRWS